MDKQVFMRWCKKVLCHYKRRDSQHGRRERYAKQVATYDPEAARLLLQINKAEAALAKHVETRLEKPHDQTTCECCLSYLKLLSKGGNLV